MTCLKYTPIAIAIAMAFASPATIAKKVNPNETLTGDQTIIAETLSGNVNRGAAIESTSGTNSLTVTGGTLKLTAPEASQNWQRLVGVNTDNSTLTIDAITEINLTTKGPLEYRVLASGDKGIVNFVKSLTVIATTDNAYLDGLNIWDGSKYTFSGDKTSFILTSQGAGKAAMGVRTQGANNSVDFKASKTEFIVKSDYRALGINNVSSSSTITIHGNGKFHAEGKERAYGAFMSGGLLTFKQDADLQATATSTQPIGNNQPVWSVGLWLQEGATAHVEGNLTSKSLGGEYARGISVFKSALTVNGITDIAVNDTNVSEENPTGLTKEAYGVYSGYSGLTFENNAKVTVNGGADFAWGVRLESDPGQPAATATFNGQSNVFDVTSPTAAVAVSASGGPDTKVTFNSGEVIVGAHSSNGYAAGLDAQYGSSIIAKTAVNVNVDGQTAYGVRSHTYGSSDRDTYAFGQVNLEQGANINVEGANAAYGVAFNATSGHPASVVSPNDGINLGGTSTITVTSVDGNAVGVLVQNTTKTNGDASVNSDGKVTLNNATITATGKTATGIKAENRGKVVVNGESSATANGATSTGVVLDQGSSLLIESVQGQQAQLSTNSMTSTGTTKLDQGTLSVHNAEGKSSTLGNVSSTGGTVDLGSGDYTVSKLETTAGATTTLQLNDFNAKVAVQEKTGDVGSLTLKGTSAANGDQYENADAAAKALVDAVTKNSTGVDFVGEKVVLEQGLVNDGQSFTIGANGEQVNKVVTKNNTLTAYNGLATLTTFQWRHDMNDLTKRMGELRLSPDGVGAWARVYGSKQTYGTQGLTAKNHSLQVGVDTTVTPEWTVGTAFTYTDGKSTYDLGSADNKAYGFAAYGTWMAENGQFVDLIAKYSRLSNDFTVNQEAMAGSFDNNAFSVSAEYGWHWNLNDVGFLEPQAELTYGKVLGETFTANNGVKVVQEDFESLIARLGVRGGFYFPNQKGVVYARASVLHDFKGEMESTASKNVARNTVKDDIGGTWVEWGVGANFKLSDTAYTYVDVERTNGGEVVEDWRYNAGVRLVF